MNKYRIWITLTRCYTFKDDYTLIVKRNEYCPYPTDEGMEKWICGFIKGNIEGEFFQKGRYLIAKEDGKWITGTVESKAYQKRKLRDQLRAGVN